MDIWYAEIRILFSRQPVRYRGVMNECQDKRKDRSRQVIVGMQNGRLEGGGGRAPTREWEATTGQSRHSRL